MTADPKRIDETPITIVSTSMPEGPTAEAHTPALPLSDGCRAECYRVLSTGGSRVGAAVGMKQPPRGGEEGVEYPQGPHRRKRAGRRGERPTRWGKAPQVESTRFCGHFIVWMKGVHDAAETPPSDRRTPQQAEQRPAGAKPGSEVRSRPSVDKDALDYLQLVASEPFLSVRERNEHFGLSACKGQEIKKALLDTGLVREAAVNPGGRGERFKLLEFTAAGRELLADYGISSPSGRGRGGIAHQWWVDTIAGWLEGQDLDPSIEDETKGVRVDLLVITGRRKTATEP